MTDIQVPSSGEDSETLGMDIEVAELYRIAEGYPWSDKRPNEMDDFVDISVMKANCAVIVRKQTERENGEFVLYQITIQSPLIRNLLHKVFDEYKGVSTRLKDLTFTAPFHEFFYRWDEFQQAIAEEKDEATLKHVELLQNIITPEIQPHIFTRDDLLSQKLITYDYLWTIFEPGVEVFSKIKDCDRLFIYDKSQLTGNGHVLTCKYIDFNGMTFGYASTNLMIPAFKGVLPLSELQVLPVDLHAEPESLRADALRRGRCFESLAGVHYKSYVGFGLINTFLGEQRKYVDSARIMIDSKMYFQQNPNQILNLRPLQSLSKPKNKSHRRRGNDDDYDEDDWVHYDMGNDYAYNPNVQAMQFHQYTPFPGQVVHAPPPPPPPPGPQPRPRQYENDISASQKNRRPLLERESRLCTSTVRGFNLFSHEWGMFFVDQVLEIEFSQDAFPRLVLPYDYKELILAITKSQLSCEDKFDDIIQGKGQGIIMLLQGEPGVGKTLTAEATAEEMKRPLYAVSAGELGYSAGEVEKNLRTILEMSTKWRAVLLIDECDVFLEQRTLSDIDRNKLVAVFLRLLEYFKGVMFLTANRVSTFDPAFQSRIHLSINYPQLDVSSRKHVWRTFVPETPKDSDVQYQSQLSDADIAELSSIELNGREIKNIVKTARLLSTSKGVPLSMEHVSTVLRIKSKVAGE